MFIDCKLDFIKLVLFSYARPDVQHEVFQLEHAVKNTLLKDSKEKLKRLSHVFNCVAQYPVEIAFLKLKIELLQVVGFSKTIFASSDDRFTQLSFTVFLDDEFNKSFSICFKFCNTQIIVWLGLRRKSINFSRLFNHASAQVSKIVGMIDIILLDVPLPPAIF